MIKRYIHFINESIEEVSNNDKYSDLEAAVKSLIESTIENMGGEYETFLDSFIKNPEDYQIEGLINDSDVMEFYLKYRTDIDELLNEVKFYDEVPSNINSYGLYSYTIIGTKRAVQEICRLMA